MQTKNPVRPFQPHKLQPMRPLIFVTGRKDSLTDYLEEELVSSMGAWGTFLAAKPVTMNKLASDQLPRLQALRSVWCKPPRDPTLPSLVPGGSVRATQVLRLDPLRALLKMIDEHDVLLARGTITPEDAHTVCADLSQAAGTYGHVLGLIARAHLAETDEDEASRLLADFIWLAETVKQLLWHYVIYAELDPFSCPMEPLVTP